MAFTPGVVRVEGLQELNRAFRRIGGNLPRELRTELREVAEPVRSAAERLAATNVRNLAAGDPWTRMRTGVTQRLVYVAPRQKGTRTVTRRRPNLATLLMDRAMLPALVTNEPLIVAGVDRVLDRIADEFTL